MNIKLTMLIDVPVYMLMLNILVFQKHKQDEVKSKLYMYLVVVESKRLIFSLCYNKFLMSPS